MDYKQALQTDILPFWLDHAIDTVNGGIFTQLDKKGNLYGREKSVWFQGRALWVFAKAYNLIEKNAAYLAAAKTIFAFLARCTDKDGRMFFTVTADGRGLQKRRYYFSETFAAIGCAEYYKASGDKRALETAMQYFEVAYACYTGARKTQPKIAPENFPAKALSPIMILLSTAQVMRTLPNTDTALYSRIAAACADEILHGGFLTSYGLLENVSTDGKPLDAPAGRIVNPGHSMEAAWFLMAEGLTVKNSEMLEAGKRIIDLTLPLGYDEKHGGLIAFTDALGKPPMQLEWDMKLWWPQCEAMIALRLAGELFGEEKYRTYYERLLAYTQEYFVDREDSEWYGYLHYDNTVSTTLKGNIFKGPFHIPRLYMLMAVLDRDGKIDAFMQ